MFLISIICCSINVKADFSGMNIAPDSEGDLIAFGLLAYNSYVLADDYLYISYWEWSADDTAITFYDVYMNTGEAIYALKIETNINATFSMISNRQLTYIVSGNGTQIFNGVLEPSSVTIDGVLTDNFTYSEANESLIINSAVSTVDIVFQSSGLTADIAVVLVIVFGIIAIAVALIFAISKRRSD